MYVNKYLKKKKIEILLSFFKNASKGQIVV